MSTERANWDDTTVRTFLKLVIEQKKPIALEPKRPHNLGVGKFVSSIRNGNGVDVRQEIVAEQA